jgi:hypothetical protein
MNSFSFVKKRTLFSRNPQNGVAFNKIIPSVISSLVAATYSANFPPKEFPASTTFTVASSVDDFKTTSLTKYSTWSLQLSMLYSKSLKHKAG